MSSWPSSGQAIAIKHPENLLVLENTLMVAEPDSDMVQGSSLIHIVAVRRRQAALPS